MKSSISARQHTNTMTFREGLGVENIADEFESFHAGYFTHLARGDRATHPGKA
jgi:hypothetical protein